MKAVEFERTGNKKNGYPELTDCLYHALAIMNNAVFYKKLRRKVTVGGVSMFVVAG
jgi:hypothetical protein